MFRFAFYLWLVNSPLHLAFLLSYYRCPYRAPLPQALAKLILMMYYWPTEPFCTDRIRFPLFLSEPRPANISADIVFLVDSSTPVGQGGFDREKRFVKSLAKYLNVSPQKSKAAVIAYNDTAYTVLKFTEYQTEVEFSLRLDMEEWFGGIRNITGALEGAATLLSQARANSPKIVVLVTAGRHISGDIIADSLKKLAATVIVVTVGSDADYRDFLPVVDSIDDLFVAPSFDDLGYEVQPIVKYIVKRLGELSKFFFNYTFL